MRTSHQDEINQLLASSVAPSNLVKEVETPLPQPERATRSFIIEHTPTPWHANIADPFSGWDILADQGPIQVMPARAYGAGDAAFIVKAVNAHDDLLAALKLARRHLEFCNYGDKWESECAVISGLGLKIDAAIAKAEGVTP